MGAPKFAIKKPPKIPLSGDCVCLSYYSLNVVHRDISPKKTRRVAMSPGILIETICTERAPGLAVFSLQLFQIDVLRETCSIASLP